MTEPLSRLSLSRSLSGVTGSVPLNQAAGAVRRRASGWAAWIAFTFACGPLIGAQQLNGELVASAAVMTSVAARMHVLFDMQRPRHSAALGLLAGALARAEVLTKQNFVDALMFAGRVAARRRRDEPPAPGRCGEGGWVAG